MRPGARTMRDVSTPKRRSSPTTASAMGWFGGSTVTKRAGSPKVATATATLASPPPKVATNCGDCSRRSKPGGASRSMISPKVTVVVGILFLDGDYVHCESGVHRRQALKGQHGAGRRTRSIVEFATNFAHLLRYSGRKRIHAGEGCRPQ